jgi:hypothetical protein
MAVSRPGSRIRVAVVGGTKEEALARFSASLEAWAKLEDNGLDE